MRDFLDSGSILQIALVVGLWIWRRKQSRHSVPGPARLPVIGSTWLYTPFGPYTIKKYHESSRDKFEKYGPVVAEDALFNATIFHLFDADDILKILNCNSEFPIRPPNDADVFYRKSRPDVYSDIGMTNENGRGVVQTTQVARAVDHAEKNADPLRPSDGGDCRRLSDPSGVATGKG